LDVDAGCCVGLYLLPAVPLTDTPHVLHFRHPHLIRARIMIRSCVADHVRKGASPRTGGKLVMFRVPRNVYITLAERCCCPSRAFLGLALDSIRQGRLSTAHNVLHCCLEPATGCLSVKLSGTWPLATHVVYSGPQHSTKSLLMFMCLVAAMMMNQGDTSCA
jgi:hypothetical protein